MLEELLADWNRYQDDKASFDQWMSVAFATEVHRLRELKARLREKEDLLRAIKTEVDSGRANSYSDAYANIQRRRIGSAPFTDPNAGQAPAPVDDSRLKQLHRILARRLHPDTRPGGNATAPELWHEADAAYTAKDVKRLEVLVAMTTVQLNGLAAETSEEKMRSMLAIMRREFEVLWVALEIVKQEPAWNFRLLKNRSQRAVKVGSEMESQIRDIQHMLLNVDEMLAGFSQPSEPRSRFSRRGRWAAR